MTDKSINVLLIEDNSGDRRLIQEMLSEVNGAPFDPVCVDRLSAGLERISANEIDVLLLDLELPDSHGMDTFSRVQAQSSQIPVIILTGLDDAMVAIRAVREGAQDYLVKGQVDGNLLTRSLYYAIARKTAEKRVKHLNSIFRAFRSITLLTVVEKDRGCLLRKACDILEDIRGYDAVWLGLLQNGGTFATVVGSGVGFGSEENVPGLCDRLMRGDIPQCVSNALECGDRFMVVDKSISCEGCFFGDAYPESETVIIPVGHEERLFGLFIVSLATDLATEYEEIELLMDVSDNVGFALHTLEMEDSILKRCEVR
ncbi:MAG: Regulator of RpoS [Candidatus Methanogasteraceae archaeon]|nr:MAG: Regulator of RpoS [ANME-2 cluster archaeon]